MSVDRIVQQTESDQAVLARWQKHRDMDAFRTLIDRHQADLLRTAHALLGCPHAAQDAVQEGFLRLCREAPALTKLRPVKAGDRQPGLGGWLCTVVRNHCIDRLRQRGHAPGQEPERSEPATAPDPAPAVAVADAEERTALWSAVAALPALERAAVVLRYRDGLSYQDIAARLGKTVSHVGVLLHEGLNRLRTMPSLRALSEAMPAVPHVSFPSQPTHHPVPAGA